jgi:XTP/dITP diphosphohydrolase
LALGLGHWVLGEDSGLVVPALHGRPGVLSARYAGKQGDDNANNAKLLAELGPLPDDRRAAYYVCTAALSDPRGEVKAVTEGRCHGVILRDFRGTGGFGYDPLFLIPEYHQTFGELSARVKHALSHRARALARLRPTLRQFLMPS